MTINRRSFYTVLLSVALSSLLFFGHVQACSISPLTIIVRCGNDEASGKMIYEYRDFDRMTSYPDFENAYDKLNIDASKCSQLVPSLRTIFKQHYENWHAGAYSSRLAFEPYSGLREAELEAKRNELTTCTYDEFIRDGDWLITYYTARKYCMARYCLIYGISPGQFFSFLFENFSGQTAPYLVGYIVFSVVVAGLFLAFWLSSLMGRQKVEIVVILWLISWVIWLGDVV